jgi:hypothetical protein
MDRRILLGRRALLLAGLAGLGTCLGACGTTGVGKGPEGISARGDEDLIALLPIGLDAVLDVETATLRDPQGGGAVLALLPERGQRLLRALAPDPMRDLDALALGITGLGTEAVDVLVVARGRPSWDLLLAELRREAPDAEVLEYHQTPLWESPRRTGRAACRLGARTVVLGGRVAVRQVIDNYYGDGQSAAGQKALLAALARAPRAVSGRPAVRGAVLITPALRERLHGGEPFATFAEARFLAVSLAAGDGVGIDLGAVAGYPDLAQAQKAAQGLRERAEGLRRRPGLVALGLGRFIEPLVVVAALAAPLRKDPELHLAYRLPGDELRALLALVERLKKVAPGG